MAKHRRAKRSSDKVDKVSPRFAGEIPAQMDLIGMSESGKLFDRLNIKKAIPKLAKLTSLPDLTFDYRDFTTNGDLVVFKSHVINRFRQFIYDGYKSINHVFLVFHNRDFYGSDSKELGDDGKPKYKAGQLKTIHAHVVIIFKGNSGKKLKAIQKAFYDTFNIIDGQGKNIPKHFDSVKSEGGAVSYLTHTYDTRKAPYSLDDMVCWTVRHTNSGKNKAEILEDIGDAQVVTKTPTQKLKQPYLAQFWLSEMKRGKFAQIAGRVGQDAIKAGRWENPRNDDADVYGQVAKVFGWVSDFPDHDYDNGEVFITRQSGKANRAFLKYRAKFNANQNPDRPYGAKEGGSEEYKGRLHLTPETRNDTSEIEQINSDLSHGLIHIKDVKRILNEDFGAKGDTAYIRHVKEFRESTTQFYRDWLEGKIKTNKIGVTTKLTLIFMNGAGGSGKDAVAKQLSKRITEYRNANRPKGERPYSEDFVFIHGSGAGKTPDLYSHWNFAVFVIFSDVDGNNFNHHEFTGTFDPYSRSAEASSRNEDKTFLPNYVTFTNKLSLHNFCFKIIMNQPDGKGGEPNGVKLKYGQPSKSGNNKLVYRDFNTSEATYDVVYQLTRRIPFFVKYVPDPSNSRLQTVQVFIMIPKWQEYVQVDEFSMKRCDRLSPASISAESLKTANRISDTIYSYDWTGEFGHQQQLPIDAIAKYDNAYDVVKDSTHPLDIVTICREMLDNYANANDEITDVYNLTGQNYHDFKVYLKVRLMSIYKHLEVKSNGEHKHFKTAIKFALSKLKDIETPYDSRVKEAKATKSAIKLVEKIKANIDAPFQVKLTNDDHNEPVYSGYPNKLLEAFADKRFDNSSLRLANSAYLLSHMFFAHESESVSKFKLSEHFGSESQLYQLHHKSFTLNRDYQLARFALRFADNDSVISPKSCDQALVNLSNHMAKFDDELRSLHAHKMTFILSKLKSKINA